MISCVPKPVKRGAIQFGPQNITEIVGLINRENLDSHQSQNLVNTKRYGWQNVNYGDYLIFDEDNRLLKVLKPEDFIKNYIIEDESK